MPLTVHLNEAPGKAIFQEWSDPNGQGMEVPPKGPILYASSDESVAKVDQTGQLSYIGVGTATITGSDPALTDSTPPALPASDDLTIVAPVAASSTLKLVSGVPVVTPA